MQDGRSSATAADVLIGVGGSLAVTGAVLLVLASVLDAPAPSKTKTALQRASDRRRVGPGSEHRGRTEAGGRMVRWTVGGRSGRRCSRSCWRRAARRSKGSTRTTAWAAAARAAPRERRRHRGAAAARPVRAEGAVCILATVPDPPEGVDDGGADRGRGGASEDRSRREETGRDPGARSRWHMHVLRTDAPPSCTPVADLVCDGPSAASTTRSG
ncbi:MAG: hypothetical protein R3F14_09570 [Polyangiaceae bacterium]